MNGILTLDNPFLSCATSLYGVWGGGHMERGRKLVDNQCPKVSVYNQSHKAKNLLDDAIKVILS